MSAMKRMVKIESKSCGINISSNHFDLYCLIDNYVEEIECVKQANAITLHSTVYHHFNF